MAPGRTGRVGIDPKEWNAGVPATASGAAHLLPVLSEEYAVKIAREWNVPASGSGYVTRFEVRRGFLENYNVQKAGGSAHLEYWIPAEEMAAFNEAIVREIEVVAEFR